MPSIFTEKFIYQECIEASRDLNRKPLDSVRVQNHEQYINRKGSFTKSASKLVEICIDNH